RGVVGLGEFRRDVDLGAATIAGPPDALADPVEVRLQLRARIVPVRRCDGVPLTPEVPILALEERGDEVVLRAEMPIEARLGDAGLLDHEIHAHGADAPFVEQSRSRVEDAVPHGEGAVVAGAGWV